MCSAVLITEEDKEGSARQRQPEENLDQVGLYYLEELSVSIPIYLSQLLSQNRTPWKYAT